MKRLEKIEDEVKRILECIPQARGDDMYLYYKYCTNKCEETPLSFIRIFSDPKHREERNIPVFESVSRARRKLQQEYEYLRPEKKVQETRINKEGEYIRYAIDDSRNSSFKRLIDQD